ncbi:hypothetical protein M5K25_016413 [Dendrobium thyrsiflorum]|uniref:Uncharacterized protein n=1 Tax=Dendrobium thyrsiflorum TaxID=117978 RepID=A0ABD0URQ2_DENTH
MGKVYTSTVQNDCITKISVHSKLFTIDSEVHFGRNSRVMATLSLMDDRLLGLIRYDEVTKKFFCLQKIPLRRELGFNPNDNLFHRTSWHVGVPGQHCSLLVALAESFARFFMLDTQSQSKENMKESEEGERVHSCLGLAIKPESRSGSATHKTRGVEVLWMTLFAVLEDSFCKKEVSQRNPRRRRDGEGGRPRRLDGGNGVTGRGDGEGAGPTVMDGFGAGGKRREGGAEDKKNNYAQTLPARMVGEWMMDPIKIPWFCRPGPSWSLVYLVRGGSRPNLTEGSLSAAMGCFVQGYLVDLGGFDVTKERIGSGHNRYIVVPFGGRTTRFRGPQVITIYPTVSFSGKIADNYN